MIPEARLATVADAAGLLAAQNETAAALSALSVPAWTDEQVRGILENAAHPRGQFIIFAVDPVVGEHGLAGFMLAKRYRNQPPEPDPTVVTAMIVCSRIYGQPVADRARFRYVIFSTFKALASYCFENTLTWKAMIPPGVFAVTDILDEMMPAGITVSEELRGGVVWRIVHGTGKSPDQVQWPEG